MYQLIPVGFLLLKYSIYFFILNKYPTLANTEQIQKVIKKIQHNNKQTCTKNNKLEKNLNLL